jgi:hypothetical protein
MEKFDIIKESQLAEIKFERLSQIKTYAVFESMDDTLDFYNRWKR